MKPAAATRKNRVSLKGCQYNRAEPRVCRCRHSVNCADRIAIRIMWSLECNIPMSFDRAEPRLTALSHGGGCGCKIAPGVLAELLKGSLPSGRYPDLMVGTDTSDDAAVYRLDENL